MGDRPPVVPSFKLSKISGSYPVVQINMLRYWQISNFLLNYFFDDLPTHYNRLGPWRQPIKLHRGMKIERRNGYNIIKYLEDILPKIKGPVIFELGAKDFQSGKMILDFCKDFVYYGFEPDPVNFPPQCRRPPFLENKPPKLNMIQAAISDFDGKATFYQSSGLTTGASSLKEPTQVTLDCWPRLKFDSSVTVDVMKLDTFCKKEGVSHIDFIWADIQGAEYDMIMGGQETLKSTKLLYMEYSDLKLYKGQASLSKMIGALPGNWRLIHKFPRKRQFRGVPVFGDVLLQNDDVKW
jgi:FkbM family methyltransferase